MKQRGAKHARTHAHTHTHTRQNEQAIHTLREFKTMEIVLSLTIPETMKCNDYFSYYLYYYFQYYYYYYYSTI